VDGYIFFIKFIAVSIIPITKIVPKMILLYFASQFGRYMSKLWLLFLVYFSARGVSGQVHLLNSKTVVSVASKIIKINRVEFRVFVSPAYRMYKDAEAIIAQMIVWTSFIIFIILF